MIQLKLLFYYCNSTSKTLSTELGKIMNESHVVSESAKERNFCLLKIYPIILIKFARFVYLGLTPISNLT